jgi:hypothetical protein
MYGFAATSSSAWDIIYFGRMLGSTGYIGFRRSLLKDLVLIPEHCSRRGSDYVIVSAALGAALWGELTTISASLCLAFPLRVRSSRSGRATPLTRL